MLIGWAESFLWLHQAGIKTLIKCVYTQATSRTINIFKGIVDERNWLRIWICVKYGLFRFVGALSLSNIFAVIYCFLFVSFSQLYLLINLKIFSSIAQTHALIISIMNLNMRAVLWYSDQEEVKCFTVSGLNFVKKQIRVEWKHRSVMYNVYPSERLHRRCCRGEVT